MPDVPFEPVVPAVDTVAGDRPVAWLDDNILEWVIRF